MTLLRRLTCKVLVSTLLLTSVFASVEWKPLEVKQEATSSRVTLGNGAAIIHYTSSPSSTAEAQEEDYVALKTLIDTQSGAYYGPTQSLPHLGYRWVSIKEGKVYANLTSIYSPFTGLTTTYKISARVPDEVTNLTETDWQNLEALLKEQWNTPSTHLQNSIPEPSLKDKKKSKKNSDTKISPPYVNPQRSNKTPLSR